jgi:hypothetical protein
MDMENKNGSLARNEQLLLLQICILMNVKEVLIVVVLPILNLFFSFVALDDEEESEKREAMTIMPTITFTRDGLSRDSGKASKYALTNGRFLVVWTWLLELFFYYGRDLL